MIPTKQREFKNNAVSCEEFISLHGGLTGAYSHIAEAGDFSLQKISYDEDDAYLKNILSVLRIITSVIAKPHISTKREEIFTRIEQAGQITPDDFSRACRDTSLWKRRGVKMIPEEIYYYRNEDELAIYENRFIVLLVKLLSEEIIEMRNMYSERLPKLGERGDILEAETIGSGRAGGALERLKDIEKRISYIKNTDFYKIVSLAKPIEGKITPTNILLKDLKYRTCFKFYNEFLKYAREGEYAENMISITEIYILKALSSLGYDFKKDVAGECTISSNADDNHAGNNDGFLKETSYIAQKEGYIAQNGEFTLGLKFVKSGIVILSASRGGYTARHALFTGSADEKTAKTILKKLRETNVLTIEQTGVWALKDIETGKTLTVTNMTEEECVKFWLLSKTKLIKTDSAAYKKYCPICGNTVSLTDGRYVCPKCGSQYGYTETAADEGEIWLMKLRRGI